MTGFATELVRKCGNCSSKKAKYGNFIEIVRTVKILKKCYSYFLG
jgi:hypothetical protein